jgi:dynein heavy chain
LNSSLTNFIEIKFIRKQLSEQSATFKGVDQQMNEFISKQQESLNVIEICNQKGILKFFEIVFRELTVAEKSLWEYLETKRMAFPRVYFVSANDLLDILSKGRNPKEIKQHFGKTYDNLAKIA